MGKKPPDRFCPCGTKLSRYNSGTLCAICDRAEKTADLLEDNSGLIALALKRLVKTYAHPEHHSSPAAYLDRLTHPLDDLCRALGVEPPRIEDAFKVSEVGAVGGEVGALTSGSAA